MRSNAISQIEADTSLSASASAAAIDIPAAARLRSFARALSLMRYDATTAGHISEWMEEQLAAGTCVITTDRMLDAQALAACVGNYQQQQIETCKHLATPADALRRQVTPMLLTDPVWLAGIAGPGIAESPLAAWLWPVYHQRLHDMQQLRIATGSALSERGAFNAHSFWRIAEYNVAALTPAVWHLGLAEFTRGRWPEIVGYTLGYLLWQRELANLRTIWHFGELCGPLGYADAQHGRVMSALDALLHHLPTQETAQRVLAAAALPSLFFLSIAAAIDASIPAQDLSPEAAMLHVLVNKLPYARGHHRDKQLAGVPLEKWFAGPDSAQALLGALAGSKWVNRQAPLQSRLLTELLAFGGPMFQIFTTEEIEVIKRWLVSLQHTVAPAVAIPVEPPAPVQQAIDVALTASRPCLAPLPVRTQFHHLLNRTQHPEIVDHAYILVAQRVRQATRWQRWSGQFSAPSFDYSDARFNARVQAIYANAVRSYRPLSGSPWLNREDYLWLLRNLAPLFLVDGCWLQQAGTLVTTVPDVARGLLDILGDEIGAGEQSQNHAYVFRRLLASEGCEFPAVDEQAFAEQADIVTVAYELPAYLLAISLQTRAYLPELLGLNLAIELSGLGGFYMRLVDELRYHGFDPTIISLHISIDNMASGHAAVARDLIPTYLAEIESCHGPAAVQAHWRRVWAGYCSLDYMSRRLLMGLAGAYCRRYAGARIRRYFARGFGAVWPKSQQPL